MQAGQNEPRIPRTWEANLVVAIVLILAMIGGAAFALAGNFSAMIFAQAIIILPAIVWIAIRRYPVRATLHLYPINWRIAAWSAIIGLACWPAVAGMAALFERGLKLIGPGPGIIPPTGWAESIIYAFVLIILAPWTEEPVFRGFVLSAWMRRGIALGLVMSGFLFALVHFQLAGLVPLTLLAIALGILVQQSSSLYASIIAHACYNIVGALYIIIPSLRETPDQSLIIAGAIALPIAILLLWAFTRRFPASAESASPPETSAWIWTVLSLLVVLLISGLVAVGEVTLRLSPNLVGS